MSGTQAEDSGLAVSTEDFLAALTGGAESESEPTAATPEPAQAETPAQTPATETPEAPTDTPAETPPAQTPDELATLRAELAALRQEQERQRGTYDNNTRQQRETLEAARREAETLRQQNAELARTRGDAEEAAFRRQIEQWESQYQQIGDPQQRTAARAFIDAEVKAHDADRRTAEAQRMTETFAPVMQQLEGLRAANEITTAVQRNVGLIQGEGAAQLAAEVGADVAEVRAYLQRPEVAASYQQIFALMKQAELTGQPVPAGLLQGLGGQHRAYWAERVAERKAAETRLIEGNQRDLVASGAGRGDGGGGTGAPGRQINTMDDVTTDDWLRMMRGEPVRR